MSGLVKLGRPVSVRLPSMNATIIAPLETGKPGRQGDQGPAGPPASPLASPDAAKRALLDPRDADADVEWAGGDAADNIRMSNGKDLFFWGDTFLGDITLDGQWGGGNYTDFQRRSITMIDPATGATTLYDEDSALLTPLKTLPGGAVGEWGWFGGVAGDDGGSRAFALVQGISPTGGGGAFAFAESGRTYLAEFDITGAAPTLVTFNVWCTEAMPGGIVWGGAAWRDPDGYVYVLGRKSVTGGHATYVRRVLASNVWGTQQWWTGTAWASTGTPAPVATFPYMPTGVRKIGDTYYGLVAPFMGKALQVWSSPSITSGWTKVGDAWSYPDTDHLFYYSPRWVPQWDDPTGLAVIVPHNAVPGTGLEPMDYVPDVIRVSRLIVPMQATFGVRSMDTTNGTITSLQILTNLPANITIDWSCDVVARDLATGDSKSWHIEGTCRYSGTGSVVQIGSGTVLASETSVVKRYDPGTTSWTLGSLGGSGTLNLRPTGEAGKTIRWVARNLRVEVVA